jgi:hypothetical protein
MHALVLKGLSKSNFRLLFHRFCLAPAMEWRGRRPLRTVARWSKGLLIPLLLSYYNAITYCIIKKIEAGCVYIRVCKRCFSKKEKLDWWRGRRRLTARYACMTQTCRPFGIFWTMPAPNETRSMRLPRQHRVLVAFVCPIVQLRFASPRLQSFSCPTRTSLELSLSLPSPTRPCPARWPCERYFSFHAYAVLIGLAQQHMLMLAVGAPCHPLVS